LPDKSDPVRATIHDIRNQLAVAVAHLEAFSEGKLEPTPARLAVVLAALGELDALLDRLRAETVERGER